MSALMAERRDWAEEPRQASLFDVLAPPSERAQTKEAPREEAQIVEFPLRRDRSAPEDTELAAEGTLGPESQSGIAAGPKALAPTEAATGGTTSAALAAQPEAVVGGVAFASAPAVGSAPAIEPELVVAPETGFADLAGTPRAAGAPLAGPTLDDVMSRVWEGLVTGLPAACPVCHGEVLPSAAGPRRGHCASCDTTID